MPVDSTQGNSIFQLENQPMPVDSTQGCTLFRPLVDVNVAQSSEFDAIMGEVTEIWQDVCQGQHPMEALREALNTKAAKLNFCKTFKSAMVSAHPDFMKTITTMVQKGMLETYVSGWFEDLHSLIAHVIGVPILCFRNCVAVGAHILALQFSPCVAL